VFSSARTWPGGSAGYTEPYLELNIMVPCWPAWPPTRPGKTRRRKLHRLPAGAIDRGRRQGRGVQIMSGESVLVILLVGLIAGWLAGQLVQGTGYGLFGDIAIGLVGALIASWLFPKLGVRLATGILGQILYATIGAVLLLVIARLVRGGGRW